MFLFGLLSFLLFWAGEPKKGKVIGVYSNISVRWQEGTELNGSGKQQMKEA